MSKELFIDGEWDVRGWEIDAGFGCFPPYILFTFAYLPKTGYKLDYDIIKKNLGICAAAPEMYRNNEQTLEELGQMIPAMLAVCAECNHKKCKVCQFAKVLKTASDMERRIEQLQKKAKGEE